jgi:hypothetical protein
VIHRQIQGRSKLGKHVIANGIHGDVYYWDWKTWVSLRHVFGKVTF